MNKRGVLSFLLFLSIPMLVLAHPLDVGLLQSQVQGNEIKFSLQLDPKGTEIITGVRSESLQSDTIGAEKDLLFAATLGAAPVVLASGQECTWGNPQSALLNGKVVINVNAKCPADVSAWSLAFPFFKHAPTTFELVAKIDSGKAQQEYVANLGKPQIDVSVEAEHTWGQFIMMGVKHIGAVPSEWYDKDGFHFPDGIDHILFVLALVLGGGGFIGIIKTVTGFTIGHSLTLALATLGWVSVPSRLVESAIALSIAIVAAESIFLKNSKNRWKIAMAFGLIHGLGFASALGELHLRGMNLIRALLGFNFGVEMGQALIVLILLPIVYSFQFQPTLKRYAVPTCASAVLLMGGYWFIQRAFGL